MKFLSAYASACIGVAFRLKIPLLLLLLLLLQLLENDNNYYSFYVFVGLIGEFTEVPVAHVGSG